MLHLNVGADWLHYHICVLNQEHGVEVYQGPKDDQAGAEYKKWADFVNSTNSQIGRIVQARNLAAAVNKGENVLRRPHDRRRERSAQTGQASRSR